MSNLTPVIRTLLPPDDGIIRRPSRDKSKVEETPTLVITATGLKTLNTSYSYSSTFTSVYAQTKQKVKEEDYDKVRVKNPEDPEQYVDMDAPTRHKINREEGTTKNHDIKYPKVEEKENIEILERDLKRKIKE